MEMKNYYLKDVCNIYSGGTPSTKKTEYWGGDYPWLSSGETKQDFIENTEKTITKEGIDNSSTKLAKKDMVVMASAGQGFTRGQVSYLNIDTYVNQSLLVFNTNEKILLSLYLYYNLKMRYEELRQLSDSASIRGSLNKSNISKFNIEIPSLENQEKIVKLIYNIDQKIIINQKINNNLILFT